MKEINDAFIWYKNLMVSMIEEGIEDAGAKADIDKAMKKSKLAANKLKSDYAKKVVELNNEIESLKEDVKKEKAKSKALRKKNKELKASAVDPLESIGLVVNQSQMQEIITSSTTDISTCIFTAFGDGMEDCKIGYGTRRKIKEAMDLAVKSFDYPSYLIRNGKVVVIHKHGSKNK